MSKHSEAYKEALRRLRKEEGFYTRMNVASCCGSCAAYELNQNPAMQRAQEAVKPIVWNCRSSMNESDVATDLAQGNFFVNHENMDAAAFATFQTILDEHGLNAEWDGTSVQGLEVTIK